MGIGPYKPKNLLEKLMIAFDRKFGRIDVVPCDFCKTEMEVPHTIAKQYRRENGRYNEGLSCSTECARIVLYH